MVSIYPSTVNPAWSPVLTNTRSPEKLADLAAKGVNVREGDFEHVEQLVTVLAGVDRLYIISVDDVRDGVRPRLHGNAIRAAKQVEVKHVIYSSAVKPHYSPILFLRDHAATEQIVVESGIPYTILRNSFYLETVIQSGAQAVASGTSYSAAQSGAVAYVSREDCARAAAAVLTSAGHEGAIYDITGSYAWSQEEIGGELGNLVGRTINYVSLSEKALRQGLIANGLPSHIVDMLVGLDHGVRLGALDVVSCSVERLTGAMPETLPSFLARHRDAFVGKEVG